MVELRWKYKLTYDQIVERMERDNGVIINHSAVEIILKMYEIGCAEKYRPEYISNIKLYGGIVLMIDGMEPLKGERGLYVARDHRTGLVLGSRLLPNQKQTTIEQFLQSVKERVERELGVPILGIISDALPAQRLAIKTVFPGVPHCLCHFHFYNLVLQSPKQGDSHLVTQIRKDLRDMYDIKMFKEARDAGESFTTENRFVVAILDALLTLSNWSKKPQDPCFTGLVLWQRVNDIAQVIREACTHFEAHSFSEIEQKIILRVDEKLAACIESLQQLATDLDHVREMLDELEKILSDDIDSSEEGLAKMRAFRDKVRKRGKVKGASKIEVDFCDALVKFVNTKGKLLFNYRDVEGAERTNNDHELFYKQLKHMLRKMIGFAAASVFLLGHGERIVYVKPDESPEMIREILTSMNLGAARETIANERKSRDLLMYIMHDAVKWDVEIQELRLILQES